jgi:hypothetical protein
VGKKAEQAAETETAAEGGPFDENDILRDSQIGRDIHAKGQELVDFIKSNVADSVIREAGVSRIEGGVSAALNALRHDVASAPADAGDLAADA